MAKQKKNDEVTSEEKFRVKWSKIAKKELNEIHDFIAELNPRTAIMIVRKIKAKADTLDHFPHRGSYVPELLAFNIKDIRQITEHPWRIIYKITDKSVNIITIVDSRRDLPDLLVQKFLYSDWQ